MAEPTWKENDDSFLKKFWETEEKIHDRNPFTIEESEAEEFYANTTTVGRDRRYICRLPFKANSSLGRSRHIAMENLMGLEKRFAKDEKLRERYVASLDEYFHLAMRVLLLPLRKLFLTFTFRT